MTSDELLVAWHEALQPYAVQRFVWDADRAVPALLRFSTRLALEIEATAVFGVTVVGLKYTHALSMRYTDMVRGSVNAYAIWVVIAPASTPGVKRLPTAVIGDMLRKIPPADQLLTWSHVRTKI